MLLGFTSLTQNSATAQSGSRWQIGINASPQVNYRQLRSTPGDQGSAVVTESRNKIETPRPSYTVGVSLGYQLTEHITLNSGLQYGNWGLQTELRDMVYQSSNLPLPTQIRTKYHVNYLIVPLTANVTLGQNRLKFTAGAGLNAMYMVNEKTSFKLIYEDGHMERQGQNSSFYRKFNLAPQISAGIDYALYEHMHLKLEPVFRYAVMESADAPVQEHLYNYGLNMSVYWKI